MQTLAERVQLAMKHRGVTSQTEIAKAAGVSSQAVNMWLSGETKTLKGRSLAKAAAYLGVRPEWLSGDSPIMLAKDVPREPIRAYEVREYTEEGDLVAGTEVLVDEVDIELSAGDGRPYPEFVETKFKMPFQTYWFKEHNARPEHVKIMKVAGDSMEPVLFNGDRVAVNTKDRHVVNGRVYALIYGEDRRARVKRLFRIPSGLRVVSVNKEKYPEEELSESDLEYAYIIGRVIDRSGSGGL